LNNAQKKKVSKTGQKDDVVSQGEGGPKRKNDEGQVDEQTETSKGDMQKGENLLNRWGESSHQDQEEKEWQPGKKASEWGRKLADNR